MVLAIFDVLADNTGVKSFRMRWSAFNLTRFWKFWKIVEKSVFGRFGGCLGTLGCGKVGFSWFLDDFETFWFFWFFAHPPNHFFFFGEGFFSRFFWFFGFWGVVWKFWREALGLSWEFSVGCKDSSGLVGFDYDGLHFFTPAPLQPPFWFLFFLVVGRLCSRREIV